MKKSIGFRCTPQEIHYCIISEEEYAYAVVDVDRIVVPKSLKQSNKLKYIRNIVLDILNEYEISYAGIRVSEPNSQSKKTHRLHIEGVILELFASSSLEKHYVGQISSISSLLNIPRQDFKLIIKGEIKFPAIERFCEHTKEQKEAILTALGAFSC